MLHSSKILKEQKLNEAKKTMFPTQFSMEVCFMFQQKFDLQCTTPNLVNMSKVTAI